MTTFEQCFEQHLASGETLEATACWYFSEENSDARVTANYAEMSPRADAFFDWLNDVVFTQALAETRAQNRQR
jgi:hypothetical protein